MSCNCYSCENLACNPFENRGFMIFCGFANLAPLIGAIITEELYYLDTDFRILCGISTWLIGAIHCFVTAHSQKQLSVSCATKLGSFPQAINRYLFIASIACSIATIGVYPYALDKWATGKESAILNDIGFTVFCISSLLCVGQIVLNQVIQMKKQPLTQFRATEALLLTKNSIPSASV